MSFPRRIFESRSVYNEYSRLFVYAKRRWNIKWVAGCPHQFLRAGTVFNKIVRPLTKTIRSDIFYILNWFLFASKDVVTSFKIESDIAFWLWFLIFYIYTKIYILYLLQYNLKTQDDSNNCFMKTICNI